MTQTGRKWLIRSLWAAGILIVLCAGAVCVIASIVLEREPQKLDNTSPSPFEMIALFQKGQGTWKSMRNATPVSTGEIVYTEAEFNALLRYLLSENGIIRSNPKQFRGIDPSRVGLQVRNGVFHLKYIAEAPSNPFGKYVNLRIALKASVRDGRESVKVLSAEAGGLTLSKARAEAEIGKLLEDRWQGTMPDSMIRECVTLFEADGKNVTLKFKPYELVRFIDRTSFGGSGKFIRMMNDDGNKK